MLFLFLHTSHLKKLLTFALIPNLKTQKEWKVLSKIKFEELLSLVTKESYFFNGNLYQQIVGVAMGSPLGPTLVNAFLAYLQELFTRLPI